MRTPLKYASLAELRGAIRERRLIQFHHGGDPFLAEPYEVRVSKRTGSFGVLCFVLEGPTGESWQELRYAGMRELAVLATSFKPRMPEARGLHR